MGPDLAEGWGRSVLTGTRCPGSQGGHRGPPLRSGGPPYAGSCSAHHPREEVTPVLALSAVSTFRSLARGPGDSQSPPHTAQPVQASAWTWDHCAGDGAPSPACGTCRSQPACPPGHCSFIMLPPPNLPWRGQWLPFPVSAGMGPSMLKPADWPSCCGPRAGTGTLPAQYGIRQPTASGKPLCTPQLMSAQHHHCLLLPLSPTLGMGYPRSARPHTEFSLSCTSMDPVRPV